MSVLEKKLAQGIAELIDTIVDLHPKAEKPLKKIKAVLVELDA
jgi:hypothetical protein